MSSPMLYCPVISGEVPAGDFQITAARRTLLEGAPIGWEVMENVLLMNGMNNERINSLREIYCQVKGELQSLLVNGGAFTFIHNDLEILCTELEDDLLVSYPEGTMTRVQVMCVNAETFGKLVLEPREEDNLISSYGQVNILGVNYLGALVCERTKKTCKICLRESTQYGDDAPFNLLERFTIAYIQKIMREKNVLGQDIVSKISVCPTTLGNNILREIMHEEQVRQKLEEEFNNI